jgi:hypothetical protein
MAADRAAHSRFGISTCAAKFEDNGDESDFSPGDSPPIYTAFIGSAHTTNDETIPLN